MPQNFPQDLPQGSPSPGEAGISRVASDLTSAFSWLDDQLDVAIEATEEMERERTKNAKDSLNLLTPQSSDSTSSLGEKTADDDSPTDENPLLRLQGWLDRQLEKGAKASRRPSDADEPEPLRGATPVQAHSGAEPQSVNSVADNDAAAIADGDNAAASPVVMSTDQPLVLTNSLRHKPDASGKPTGLLISPVAKTEKEPEQKPEQKKEPTVVAPSSGSANTE